MLRIGYNDQEFQLIDPKSKKPVFKGDNVITFRGELVEIVSARAPHRPGSSGYVTVRDSDGVHREVYAGVASLVWEAL
jgi:hypothetical protein